MRYREVCVSCPRCKTFETVLFRGKKMVPTKKFEQRDDGRVYHDCDGPEIPCRLFPRFPGEWK